MLKEKKRRKIISFEGKSNVNVQQFVIEKICARISLLKRIETVIIDS